MFKSLRSAFSTLLLVIGFVYGWATPVLAARLPKAHVEKAESALRLWEFERGEYLRITRLTAKGRRDLEQFLRRANPKEESLYDGVTLLVALNCGQILEGQSIYIAVQKYRCAGEPLSYLSSHAIQFGNFYLFAFVKPEDRQRTIDFLGRYREFWRQEQQRGDEGMPPGATDFVVLEEIRLFLEKGGYPPIQK